MRLRLGDAVLLEGVGRWRRISSADAGSGADSGSGADAARATATLIGTRAAPLPLGGYRRRRRRLVHILLLQLLLLLLL